MDLNLSTSRTIRDIDRIQWDQLTGDSTLHVSYPFLAATEDDFPIDPYYLLASGTGDILLGALPVYPWHEQMPWDYDYFQRFIDVNDNSPANPGDWYPILLGGTAAGYVNELIINPNLDESERLNTIRTLLDGFTQLSEQLGANSKGLMYSTSPTTTDLTQFLDSKSGVFWSGPEAWIDVEWTSFEAYLAWLPSQRREEVQRDLAHFDTNGLKISVGELGDWVEEIAPLTHKFEKHHGSQSDLSRWVQYFTKHAAELNDNSTLFLCHGDDRLVGFSLVYEWRDVLYVRTYGLDYDVLDPNGETANLIYYLPIKHAIQNGFSRIHLGMDMYESALLRGAKLSPLWSLVIGPDDDEEASEWRRQTHDYNDARITWYEETLGPLAVEKLWVPGEKPEKGKHG